MRIEEEIKLDYSDVLFRPKRSTLKSRKEVDLSRTYQFKYSNREWTGIPIMASNMDGVGELEVADALQRCVRDKAHRPVRADRRACGVGHRDVASEGPRPTTGDGGGHHKTGRSGFNLNGRLRT